MDLFIVVREEMFENEDMTDVNFIIDEISYYLDEQKAKQKLEELNKVADGYFRYYIRKAKITE